MAGALYVDTRLIDRRELDPLQVAYTPEQHLVAIVVSITVEIA